MSRGSSLAFLWGAAAGLVVLAAWSATGQQAADAPGSRPQLSRDAAEEVAASEKVIQDAFAHPDNSDLVQSAIGKAESVLRIRAAQQGETWWETVDVRHEWEELKQISELPADQRAALAGAARDKEQYAELFHDDKYKEAIQHLLAASDTDGRILGNDHLIHGADLHNLAFLYWLTKQYRASEPLFLQALLIRKKALGEENPQYRSSLRFLGAVYSSMRRYPEAEAVYRELLPIQKKMLGEENAEYASNLDDWAQMCLFTEHNEEAEPLYRQALAIRKKVLGEDHPDYFKNLKSLAQLYLYTHRYEEAEPQFKQMLAIQKSMSGEDADYATNLHELGFMYELMQRYEDSEPLYRQVLEIRKRLVGESHRDYASAMTDLARLFTWMKRYQEAEQLFRQLIAMQKGTPDRLADYATSLHELAFLYIRMERFQEAQPLLEQALDIRKIALGEDDVNYKSTLSQLSFVYRCLHLLPRDATAEIAKDETTISNAVAHPDNAELIGPAIARADHVLETRRAMQGDDWWETISARLTLGFLRQLAVIPPDQRQTVAEMRELSGSINKLALAGKYGDAIEQAKRVSTLALQIFGEGSQDHATTVMFLAQLYDASGRHEEAEPLLRQSLEMRKKLYGEEHPAYALSLDTLGQHDLAMGHYEQAELLHQQALDIFRKTQGDESANYAGSLERLADLYTKLGRYERAEQFLRQALEIRKKVSGEESFQYAMSLGSLGEVYFAMGRYQEAEPLMRQSAEVVKKVRGEANPDYATSLNDLGALSEAMGRFDQALQFQRQALEIRKKALGEEHSYFAQSLEGLASVYEDLGRYQEAEPLFRRAVEINGKIFGEMHPSYAATVHNLATLYVKQGRYDQAEPLFLRILDIEKATLGAEHPVFAASLNNLASLYMSKGEYEKAEPLVRQAMDIRRNALGARSPAYLGSVVILARLYRSMNKWEDSEPFFRQAVEMNKAIYGEINPGYVASLTDLAGLLFHTNRQSEGSLMLLQSAQVGWDYVTQNLPFMSDQQKRQFLDTSGFYQSEALVGLAFDKTGGVEAKTALEGILLKKQLLFEAQRQESGALLAAVRGAPPDWQASWREREQKRRQYAALVVQTVSEGASSQSSQGSRVDPGRLRALSDEIENLEERLRQANPAYRTAAQVRRVSLPDVSAELRTGEALIEYVRYLPIDLVQRKLGDPHYGAFVLLGGTGQVAAVDLGDAAAIDDSIGRFRAEMRRAIDQFGSIEPSPAQIRTSENRIASESSAVRDRTWQPLENQLKGIKRVYVAPDGPLSLIPFEALARKGGSAGWRYLAEDRELVYLGTGRDLGRLSLTSQNETKSNTAVLIGNPRFDAPPREVAAVIAGLSAPSPVLMSKVAPQHDASTLGAAGGGEERLQIPRNWPQAPVLQDLVQQASSQLKRLGWSVTSLTGRFAVKEAAEAVQSPRILQFATHGYILDKPNNDPQGWDNPLLRSMLILAGANNAQQAGSVFYRSSAEVMTEAQARASGFSEAQMQSSRIEVGDGILTAYEVTGMNLQGTELVNLTACETGLGEVTPDGVAGLRQAFLLAGARSLTMSMWEVPADETTHQIEDFYNRWLGGTAGTKGRYEAFRASQLAALARARQEHGTGHPFFWAGTIFVGDPGDLPTPRPASAPEVKPSASTNKPPMIFQNPDGTLTVQKEPPKGGARDTKGTKPKEGLVIPPQVVIPIIPAPEKRK
jgi:tetratricopeptide (TPR) repeat protein/CHAT domain-containing protein